jgi:hypothetical protein
MPNISLCVVRLVISGHRLFKTNPTKTICNWENTFLAYFMTMK